MAVRWTPIAVNVMAFAGAPDTMPLSTPLSATTPAAHKVVPNQTPAFVTVRLLDVTVGNGSNGVRRLRDRSMRFG